MLYWPLSKKRKGSDATKIHWAELEDHGNNWHSGTPFHNVFIRDEVEVGHYQPLGIHVVMLNFVWEVLHL